MNEKKDKERLVSLLPQIAGLALLLLCAITLSKLYRPVTMAFSYLTPTPAVAHHDLLVVKDVDQLWLMGDVYLKGGGDKTLDASAGKTCFLDDEIPDGNITCVDSNTGETVSKIRSGIHSMLSVTPNGIFVAYGSPASLRKYDLQTGNLIWRKRLSGSGSEMMFVLNNQIQVVTITYTDSLWVIDMDGNVIKTMNESRIIISIDEVTFLGLTGLRAVKATNTDVVLWDYVDTSLALPPVFTEDKIFLRNGGVGSGTAYALDRKTGELLWRVENIIGNLAYSPEKQRIYALREDGNLVAIDENDGQESVVAKFSGVPFLFSIDGYDKAYQLAYDKEERVLIVALGDGNQLFAFEEK